MLDLLRVLHRFGLILNRLVARLQRHLLAFENTRVLKRKRLHLLRAHAFFAVERRLHDVRGHTAPRDWTLTR